MTHTEDVIRCVTVAKWMFIFVLSFEHRNNLFSNTIGIRKMHIFFKKVTDFFPNILIFSMTTAFRCAFVSKSGETRFWDMLSTGKPQTAANINFFAFLSSFEMICAKKKFSKKCF